jgi:hypothetical protein
MSSLYGNGLWGTGLYSQVSTWSLGGNIAPTVTFSADIDVVGQIFFSGVLTPTVTFTGAFSVILDLHSGAITPSVAFGSDLTFDVILGGSIVAQVDLGASLLLDMGFAGNLPVQVAIACELISGPLWADSELCPSPPWTLSEPCPPPMWTPIPPPTFVIPSGSWKKQEEAADDISVWRDAAK